MDTRINYLTGGLQFKLHDEIEEEVAQLKQDLLRMYKPIAPSVDLNVAFDPQPSKLSLRQRFQLIKSFGEEIIQEDELKKLLATKQFPICYDGFEPSGRMHIAQGIMRAINVNKLIDAGCIFIFWVADWFALLNNKMDGDLDKIRTVGRYFIETWKAAGMKMHNVKFLWCSDEINKKSNDYWLQVIDVARKFNITRMKKCSQIMGRAESDELAVSQLLYPAMQCTDIFHLKADICSLGKDQRKVNMLAREYAAKPDSNYKLHTPIVVSHHMLSGLKEGQQKMSKSDPMSAIFMEDTEEDVNKKIDGAYCKPQEVYQKDGITFANPIMDYAKSIVFGAFNKIELIRKPENGGNITYDTYEQLEQDYIEGKVHPGDLKAAVKIAINKLIQPVRDHFQNDPVAKQLLSQIKLWQQQKLQKEQQQLQQQQQQQQQEQAATQAQ
ncbi:hypothetical protein ABPG74_016429 [Tetrahymena malaccensis]